MVTNAYVGRHLGYAPRESWFYKGMHAVVQQQPLVGEQAAEQLGIGLSMGRALRYWLQATGLIEAPAQARRNAQGMVSLTAFGALVWHYDRYLTQEATLCWMHAHLLKEPSLAPAWYWLFNHGPGPKTAFDLTASTERYWQWAVITFAEQPIDQSVLRRDLACLLRMYVRPEALPTPEDPITSPFWRLGLLQQVRAGTYQRVGYQRLHPLVALSLLVEQQLRMAHRSVPLPLQDALSAPGSLGRYFTVSTQELLAVLAMLESSEPSWRIQIRRDAQGRDLLEVPSVSWEEIVSRFYQR